MAWTNLFTIGSTDLTAYEDKEAHQVNRTDVYTSWTDGNWAEHRVIARTKVNGTVVLNFPRDTSYATFVSLLTSERDANGYYPIKVWCSNTNTTETLNAFLEVEGETKWDVTAPLQHHRVTVTITGV